MAGPLKVLNVARRAVSIQRGDLIDLVPGDCVTRATAPASKCECGRKVRKLSDVRERYFSSGVRRIFSGRETRSENVSYLLVEKRRRRPVFILRTTSVYRVATLVNRTRVANTKK